MPTVTDFSLPVGPGGGTGFNWTNIRRFVASNVTPSLRLIANDATVFVDATYGATPITLPAANQCIGRIYTVKKVDASANAVTLTDAIGSNIEGAASLELADALDVVTLQSDGEVWWKIA